MGPFLILQINDNTTVRFQKVIINDATNIRRINHSLTKTYQHLKTSFILFPRPLIIRASALYRVALYQPISSSLVGQHCTMDVRVTSDITVTLFLVPVDTLNYYIWKSYSYVHSSSYVPQIRVYS